MLRAREDLDTAFASIVGRPPRPHQSRILLSLERHVNGGTTPLIIEAPTGSGKSFLGLCTHGLAKKDGGRLDYVCYNVALQTQLANDAFEMAHFGGDIVVGFGRNRYYCEARMRKMTEADWRSISPSLDVDEAFRLVDEICGRRAATKPKDDVFWRAPPRDDICLLLKTRLGFGEDEAERAWTLMSAESCECYKRKEKCLQICPHLAMTQRAQMCRLFILNAALFMTHAALDNLADFLKRTSVLVFDEAHTLKSATDTLIKQSIPRTLDVAMLAERLKHFQAHGIGGIVSGVVDIPLFQSIGKSTEVQSVTYLDDRLRKALNVSVGASSTTWKLAKSVVADWDAISEIVADQIDPHAACASASYASSFFMQLSSIPGIDEFRVLWSQMPPTDVTEVKTHIGRVAYCGAMHRLETDFAGTSESLRVLCSTSPLRQTIGDLMRAAKDAHQLVLDVEWATRAKSRTTWFDGTNKIAHMVIPIVRNGLLEYLPTDALRSHLLGARVWKPLREARLHPLLMSATLAQRSVENKPFDLYMKEVGLENASHIMMPPVFDSRRLTLFWPDMRGYYYKWSEKDKADYCDQRSAIAIEWIQKNDKGTLLVATTEEQPHFEARLKRGLSGATVVNYSRDARTRDELIRTRTDWKNVVIIGTESMYTGLSLPGRIGLVLITRPLTRPPNLLEKMHRLSVLGEATVAYEDYVAYERQRRLTQAVGRLLRVDSDSGTVVLMGHAAPWCRGDVEEVLSRYPDAAVMK